MAGRKAKLMTHPLFIMSAPKAHYPLFNLVERAAYPSRRHKSRSPSWSPKSKNDQFKRPHSYPYRVRKVQGRKVGDEEEGGVVSGGTWLPVDEGGLPAKDEFGEICEEDEFFDDELSVGMEEIDMKRLCFDDDIGCNSRYVGGGGILSNPAESRSNLAKTAAEIMVALVKTEEEIRKLEQIALMETRLSRQGSLKMRGWVDSPIGSAGHGDDSSGGFFTPTTPDSAVDSPTKEKEERWEDMNASLAQLIHQERMLPARCLGPVSGKERKVHFKSNSISEGEGMARPAHTPSYAQDDGDVPRRSCSEEFLSEREKMLRAARMGASPDTRSAASTPGRPSFTLDESRSGRMFSIEKLNAEFATSCMMQQEGHIRSVARDTRRRSAEAFGATPARGVMAGSKQPAVCAGCKCIQEKPGGARRSSLEASRSFHEESRAPSTFFSERERRVFTPDRLESSGPSSKGGRRLSLPARPGLLADKVNGDSPFRHERDTFAQARLDGTASRGSFKESPLRHDSPSRNGDKPEPLQVKLAAPQSPLMSPSRFSVSSRGRDTSGTIGASPLRSRTRTRVKLRLMSPFQLLRKFKEVCARLIIAASSSVKPDPVVVAGDPGGWNPVPSRPSTSSNCSFVSASATTPARMSNGQAAHSAGAGNGSPRRISHRRSYAGKHSRGSPNLCSPAVSGHSFYSEAITDCIDFIKRSSTPDTRIV